MDRTLLDKLWDQHVVSDLGDGWSLLHIDRHLLHDLSGTAGLFALAQKKLPVRNPELAFATPDHAVSSAPGRTGRTFGPGAKLWAGLKQLSNDAGIRYFELGQMGQGIVHVMAPELGITLPGVSRFVETATPAPTAVSAHWPSALDRPSSPMRLRRRHCGNASPGRCGSGSKANSDGV